MTEINNVPFWKRTWWSRFATKVEEVDRVSSGIANGGNVEFCAGVKMIQRYLDRLLDFQRRLNERRNQSRHDMPLQMAVE